MARDPRHPPPELRPYVALIGATKTLRLIERFAGVRVYIAKRPDPVGELVRAIGAESAQRLAAEYGGEYIVLPSSPQWRVAMYRSTGLSAQTIALRIGIRESSVYRIIRQQRRDLPSTPPPPRTAREKRRTKKLPNVRQLVFDV